MLLNDATPLFVFGPPRSGTTFFTVAINRHSEVFVTNETRIMSFLHDLSRRMRQPGPLLPAHPLRASIVKAIATHSEALVREVYRDCVDKTNLGAPTPEEQKQYGRIRVWGDKNPGYCDGNAEEGCLTFISTMFPRSRFIQIIRDPRSSIGSYLQLKHVYNRDLDGCISMWLAHAAGAAEFINVIPKERAMTIKHEDLSSARGAQIMLEVQAFLHLQYEARPAEFLKRELVKRTPYRSPVTPTEKLGTVAYGDFLSAKDIELVEARTSPYMSLYNY